MTTKNNGNEPMVKLLNGYYAEEEFYEKVRQAAAVGVQRAKPGVLYTARNLCDEAFWYHLERRQKLLAGRCFAHMVDAGIFNFKQERYKRSSTWRYRLS